MFPEGRHNADFFLIESPVFKPKIHIRCPIHELLEESQVKREDIWQLHKEYDYSFVKLRIWLLFIVSMKNINR